MSDHHPDEEPTLEQKPDEQSETKPKRSGSSADGGTCGVWMLIGCLGVTLAIALLAFVGGIIYLVSQNDDQPATATATPSVATDQSADEPADTESDELDNNVAFGAGIQIVGEDIEPGIYFADQAEEFCYWERLSGFSGEFENVITNGLVDDRSIVEILESDAGFSSERCGDWRSEPGQIRPDPAALFGQGTYLVGYEIEPGTWRSEGGEESCYWVRLSGFSGELQDIVTNAFGEIDPVVEISPDDAGFHSTECGTWHRTDD